MKLRVNLLWGMMVVISLLTISGCKKENEGYELITGTATDVEGNVYKTVKIGDQWWFAENLKTIRYRDSSLIPLIQGDTALWAGDTTGAFARGSDGQWYNWYAVTNQSGLAPEGWHIPTEAEWQKLEAYIGMNPDEAAKMGWRGEQEGDRLKIRGIDEWKFITDVFGTDDFGFSATSGNCVLFDGRGGQPSGKGYTGFWWSSSPFDQQKALYRHLDYKKSQIFRYYGNKTYGFSVRCVRN